MGREGRGEGEGRGGVDNFPRNIINPRGFRV